MAGFTTFTLTNPIVLTISILAAVSDHPSIMHCIPIYSPFIISMNNRLAGSFSLLAVVLLLSMESLGGLSSIISL
jgi:hypothetical protein